MSFLEHLHIVKHIQLKFKQKKSILHSMNLEMRFLYNMIFSIMNRIHDSFKNGIIIQTFYNKLLGKLNKVLIEFKELNFPLSLSIYKFKTTKEIKTCINTLRKQLINIACVSGAESIDDLLQLLLGVNIHDISVKDKRMLKFYNRVFIPNTANLYKSVDDQVKNIYNNLDCDISLKKKDIEKMLKFDLDMINKNIKYPISVNYETNNSSLIQKIQGARLYIPCKNLVLVLNGYFKEDPLNISRIGGTLGKKNKMLLDSIENLTIPNNFKYSFVEQLSLRDFVVNTILELTENCLEMYNEFKKLKGKPISYLVKEFLLSNIERQRIILTLFLLNKDDTDNQSLAYLMYDMISNESYLLKPQPLAEQVFNSLHWSVQKLFNTAIKKIDNIQSNIKNFKEDSIPYEKRIHLMKCDDSIKHKAFEKLNELNNAKGDSNAKAQQYIDGILKIPFGIYKEEPIIHFMKDYRVSIKLVVNNLLHIVKSNYESEFTDVIEFSNQINQMDNITVNDIKKYYEIFTKNLFNLKSKFSFNKKIILEQYKSKKCSELKNILKGFKLSKSGNKSALLDRLCNYHHEKFKNKINKKQLVMYNNLQERFNKYYSKWILYNNDKQDYIKTVSDTLDNAVYGLDDAKNQIKRIIAQWINGEMKGYAFGFEGPPGTGKTTLAKLGIAKCLVDVDGNPRPFAFIALGGSSNGSTLEGHNYTYVGSTWGRIVDILMENKCMNPIIYIDELDKISKTEHGKELVGILTHLTDTSQNDAWCDKYFSGVKLDLSKILFIFSYNDPALIDKILLDRIHRIRTKALSTNEKTKITTDYLMADILNTIGFKKGDIVIESENIEYIINTYTYEAGVRKLKEKLFEIVRELNLRFLLGEKAEFPYIVSKETIQEIFIDKDKIYKKKILNTPRIGLVNGLFATSSGIGGITIIETYKSLSESRLSLELTGKQGDVMKESMRVAKTVAWNLLTKENQDKIRKQQPYGIHIHCPEAATPKDGPSAGGAITIAILSQILQLPVNNLCAMTGEIDLNGCIHAIGGLYSKLQGAKTAGVKKVLIPTQNKDDYIKIINNKDNDIYEDDDDFKVLMVDNIHQVIEHFLIFPDKSEKTQYLNYNNHIFD